MYFVYIYHKHNHIKCCLNYLPREKSTNLSYCTPISLGHMFWKQSSNVLSIYGTNKNQELTVVTKTCPNSYGSVHLFCSRSSNPLHWEVPEHLIIQCLGLTQEHIQGKSIQISIHWQFPGPEPTSGCEKGWRGRALWITCLLSCWVSWANLALAHSWNAEVQDIGTEQLPTVITR